jgi:ketopantoate reductase
MVLEMFNILRSGRCIICEKTIFYLNGKIIINNNRSLHKRSMYRKKQNYKTEMPYINGTPVKKSQKQTSLNIGTFLIPFLEGRFSASRPPKKTTNPAFKDVTRL